jgi:hypothetical protein
MRRRSRPRHIRERGHGKRSGNNSDSKRGSNNVSKMGRTGRKTIA